MSDAISATSTRSEPSTARPQPLYLHGQAPVPAAQAWQINSVGVVGSGDLSASIADRLADAGFAVTLFAESQELLDGVLARLRARFDGLIEPTRWYVALSRVDAAIVCEEECEIAVQDVLGSLERVMKNPRAILRTTASCTSEDVTEMLRLKTAVVSRYGS
jgi:3-hydroxyisobutyrate dehydrogenase-like beta-hydroxyacid dehydrogenase